MTDTLNPGNRAINPVEAATEGRYEDNKATQPRRVSAGRIMARRILWPAAIGLTTGAIAAGLPQKGVEVIKNINAASHNAAAGHSEIPSTQEGINQEAQQNIDQTQTGTDAREQLQR